MKTITFLMGLDGNDWWEDVDVTDEEYERMRISLPYSGGDFYQCEEVRDIYNRIWDIANELATESLLEYNEDIAAKYKDDKNFKASDLYQIHIQCYEFVDEEFDDEEFDDEE